MALRILGVGSPIVDLLLRVDDAFLRKYVAGEKGGRLAVKPEYVARLLSLAPGPVETAPGGSAGNTVFALARMGIDAALFGKLGEDANGAFYRRAWESTGASRNEFLQTSLAPTGCCLSLVTPDAERTMRSALGASQLLSGEEILQMDYSAYDVVHVEGYMLPAPGFPLLLQAAKAAGCRISMDLASFEIVRQFRAELAGLLSGYADVLFANRDEAAALFPGVSGEEELLEQLSRLAETAVLKLGSRGAMAACGRERVRVPAERVEKLVDTTAAGDLWAAGFFCGLSEGLPLQKCAEAGSFFAGEAVRVPGSALPDAAWERLRERFSALKHPSPAPTPGKDHLA